MDISANSHQKLQAVPFNRVWIDDTFWASRLKALKETTILACLEQCERTGRIANFAKAAGLAEGPFQGIFFDDSDVYKLLEGASYSLMIHPDPELEAQTDRIIDLIAAAQEEDGYLFTYYSLVTPEQRWTDMNKHEMYCGGHLIEAAIAYKQATGKSKLLDTACKLADHYDNVFGPGKRHWVDGHEEIELALVALYRETGEERYWKLALWLLEERGHGHGKGEIWDRDDMGAAYCQDDKPVSELSEVSGHAVRAMYLYAAMADVAAMTGDKAYMDALDRVWSSVVERNMYVTGGIGQSKHNEGFTRDYHLPNETAYCETCAAVGMVLWNHRMNLLHGHSKYADIVERAMYNGAAAGISLEGDTFFYVNPLASHGDHHRVPWFDCSCCPTQLSRFLPSVGHYIYSVADRGIVVNQYVQGGTKVTMAETDVKLEQKTAYPYDGDVQISVWPSETRRFELRLRYPGWCRGMSVRVNGEALDAGDYALDSGYLVVERAWCAGDQVELQMEMPVKRVRSRNEVEDNAGRIALERGPLVYCVEKADNAHLQFDSLVVPEHAPLVCVRSRDFGPPVTVLRGACPEGRTFTAIPYCFWDNREPGFMQVWLRERQEEMLYKG
ncbi:glycoside hydrolase family 127 protein [Paenibacillus hodogayensis]|uniref:Glycoside hydrolase family 127 protein n=1 Tax=Paenibacillus hodogayensis TaxID=279208 RepID=A0ABV5W1I4_9BACL